MFLLFVLFLTNTKKKEGLKSPSNDLFNNFIDNHYDKIFFNNANRNAAGFRFFKYIYDNLADNEELFDLYNTFYCAVSGSIIQPRINNYSIVKVKDLNGNCVFGRYYRCCMPCVCDIMKYVRVVKANLEIPKNSGRIIKRNLLTIGDPCQRNFSIKGLDKNVFNCFDNKLKLGYRVNKNNNITKDEGRLIIGVLFPLKEGDTENDVNKSINYCTTNQKRLLTKPDNLKYGMGDIFVKLALVNNNYNYTNTLNDLCKD